MPSLDFAYDLTKKLKEENIEYILICVQKGDKVDAANTFTNIRHGDSVSTFTKSINLILKDLEQAIDEQTG